jgi:hypothetical protein
MISSSSNWSRSSDGRFVVDRGQELAHLFDFDLLLQHFADTDTQTFGSPAQVGSRI